MGGRTRMPPPQHVLLYKRYYVIADRAGEIPLNLPVERADGGGCYCGRCQMQS